ncbi:hypothetical protein CONCODRAFT_14019 [Conidiobolus coronatus NRRL 28638]|uniref:Uncharacterized protein n=1 Tax=Conidiobolus coronatus (strain ATCC 28846 / CBS 209.66 / NRRL 28638) TaxID=796925 RepID=A0A137NPS9_CONC2|nr:hypothetical protein CONCODRAFT_14019 [Conidiobolus coronatus NRRL 28638]|eukprot:KXN64738.1 hypothetical protein CONCODRAFT_14019 [Conidiobolus coronatus NRRL 28638]
MNLIIYSILTRLAIGSPLVDDSTDNFPTTTNVYSYPVSTPTNTAIPVDSYPVTIPTDITTPINNYPVSTPTGVVISVYTQFPGPGYNERPHPKWNHHHKHHHKHHHENSKYPNGSPVTIVSYPVETNSATGDDKTDSGPSSTSVYAPISDSGYIDDSLNPNADNSTVDTATTEDAANGDTVDTTVAQNFTDNDTADNVTTNGVDNDDSIYNTTADDTTDDFTADRAPSTTVTVDQLSSSPTPLPDFYSQIQASSFGDV